MPRWIAIAVVVVVVGSIVALAAVPIWQRWETTPLRRGLTWTGIAAMTAVGLATVGLLIVHP